MLENLLEGYNYKHFLKLNERSQHLTKLGCNLMKVKLKKFRVKIDTNMFKVKIDVCPFNVNMRRKKGLKCKQ